MAQTRAVLQRNPFDTQVIDVLYSPVFSTSVLPRVFCLWEEENREVAGHGEFNLHPYNHARFGSQ
jgi:hypothetical protein